MTEETPLEAIETSGARAAFLRLREAADLPSGGEVTLKAECRQVAEKLGLTVSDHWTRKRIIYETWREAQKREYGEHVFDRGRYEHIDWEYTQSETFARDFSYFQSSEAHLIAKQIENNNDQSNGPFDFLEVPNDLEV